MTRRRKPWCPASPSTTCGQAVVALRELFGPQLVAYLGSVRETRAVHQWAEGAREPSAAVQQRLRVALQVAAMLAEGESPRIAQAWMQGLNPQLDDRSPVRLLRDGDDPDLVSVFARFGLTWG